MLYIAEYLVIVHKLYQLEEVSPKWVEYKQSASYVDDIRVFNKETHTEQIPTRDKTYVVS